MKTDQGSKNSVGMFIRIIHQLQSGHNTVTNAAKIILPFHGSALGELEPEHTSRQAAVINELLANAPAEREQHDTCCHTCICSSIYVLFSCLKGGNVKMIFPYCFSLLYKDQRHNKVVWVVKIFEMKVKRSRSMAFGSNTCVQCWVVIISTQKGAECCFFEFLQNLFYYFCFAKKCLAMF